MTVTHITSHTFWLQQLRDLIYNAINIVRSIAFSRVVSAETTTQGTLRCHPSPHCYIFLMWRREMWYFALRSTFIYGRCLLKPATIETCHQWSIVLRNEFHVTRPILSCDLIYAWVKKGWRKLLWAESILIACYWNTYSLPEIIKRWLSLIFLKEERVCDLINNIQPWVGNFWPPKSRYLGLTLNTG